jgi:hypothetical protein
VRVSIRRKARASQITEPKRCRDTERKRGGKSEIRGKEKERERERETG